MPINDEIKPTITDVELVLGNSFSFLLPSLVVSGLFPSLLEITKSLISDVDFLYSGKSSITDGRIGFSFSLTGVFVDNGLVYSGFSSIRDSIEFTPPLNSGFSTIGGRIEFPFSSIGVFVNNVPVYSRFSSTGGSIEFTPLLNSGLSRTGGRIKLPLSSIGELVEIGLVYSGISCVSGFSSPLLVIGFMSPITSSLVLDFNSPVS